VQQERKVIGMDRNILLKVLRDEIERSVGCTDPGAVCLAVYEATRALGQKPSQVTVTVSPNIYKNGISVGVPGTGMRGLHIAAALGAVIGPGSSGLTMLDRATEDDLAAARDLVARGQVVIDYAETPDPLYIKAQVLAGRRHAHAIISGDYTHVVDGNPASLYEVARGGQVLSCRPVEHRQPGCAGADDCTQRGSNAEAPHAGAGHSHVDAVLVDVRADRDRHLRRLLPEGTCRLVYRQAHSARIGASH
jgi:hypothetical protein